MNHNGWDLEDVPLPPANFHLKTKQTKQVKKWPGASGIYSQRGQIPLGHYENSSLRQGQAGKSSKAASALYNPWPQ